jgi:hypothetical protein
MRCNEARRGWESVVRPQQKEMDSDSRGKEGNCEAAE